MHILIYLYRAFLFTTGSYLPLKPPRMRIEESLENKLSYRSLLYRTWNTSGENKQQLLGCCYTEHEVPVVNVCDRTCISTRCEGNVPHPYDVEDVLANE